ncbi:MAG: glycosyltransferase family 4 protein [Nanoarchaeota archaeon]|nr:glycosyltransferase family 4 protein [Nanoarchaeota archaeon]
MKRLLIATDNFLPRWDGVARFLSEVIPKLSKKYMITILAPEYPGAPIEYDNVKIIRFKTFNFQINAYAPAKPSMKVIHQHVKQADLVWAQAIGPIGAAAIRSASKHKKPIAAFIHSYEWDLVSKGIGSRHTIKKAVRWMVKRYARYLYNKCDLIMVPSLEVAEIFNWMKIYPEKRLIYLGVDTTKFEPPKNKDDAKKAIGIDPKFKVIGYTGRLGREKNLITLQRAFLRLQKKRNDVVLLIVGGGVKEIETLFTNKENIIFTGFQNEVIPFLQAMDVYVLPSLTETTSLSTMEAMSCGVTPICTSVGHIKDYITEGKNGMFFRKGHFYDLSTKLEKLLNDEKTMAEMSKNARQTIVENYSWTKTIKMIEEALEELRPRKR